MFKQIRMAKQANRMRADFERLWYSTSACRPVVSGVEPPRSLQVAAVRLSRTAKGMLAFVRALESPLADAVEAVARRDLAIELGARTVRDARDGSGLSVDFTYEESGHALEVTTIPDDDAAVLREIVNLRDRLSREVAGWLVVVSASAHLKSLEGSLLSVLKTGQAIRPGEYSSADLERWMAEGQLHTRLDMHRELKQLGIVDILERPGLDHIEVMATSDLRIATGITVALADALADNAAKLAECRPRETHLVVGVARFGTARDPNESSVPLLPPAVDHLWVVHLWTEFGGRAPIWHASREAGRWDLHDLPA